MTSISRFLKGITLTIFALGTAFCSGAQTLPVCSGTGAGMIYFASHDSIFVMNPNNPAAFTYTGLTLPAGTPSASALAVSSILPGGSLAPTYYTTYQIGASRYVHYWNGSVWVNTGAVLGSDNIAAGGGLLFSYDPATGLVFKYSGTGTSTFVVNAKGATSGTGASSDIAADCQGNFYVIFQGAGILKKFSSSGAALATYTLAGTYANGAGGLAISGNNVYYDGIDSKLYTGIISGTTVTFSASASTPFANYPATDFGSCGNAGFNGNQGATDTIKFCNGASNVSLTATGPGPYNWTVVSGPGTITGSGQTVTVTATATTVITHNDANCAGTNSILDSTVIFIANGTVDAGPDRTVYTCGQPIVDSIQSSLTNTSGGVSYSYSWTPLTPIILGSQVSPTVIFQITKTTTFVLDVSTISGCHFRDSAKITVVDSTPKADFQYLIRLGCEADTVTFFNTSRPIAGIDSFAWDFRDSAGNNGNYIYSNAVSPVHIFQQQGFYPVKLLVKNAYCQDTVNKLIDVNHPLIAKFGVDDATVCSGTLITFKDSSTTPNPRAYPIPWTKALWTYYFGDGSTSNLASPTHTYTHSGEFDTKLVLKDWLGCKDSTTRHIVVDSLPFARIISNDTAICQGQAVNLKADYLAVGNTGITYDLGDGTIFQNTNNITYGFPRAGTYNVTLTAHYRYCPDFVYTFPFIVRPFPGVNIGNDTVLCPNGAPVILSDRANLGNTDARYLWNTGETTPSIAARHNGTYWARVNIGGCSATDSIVINKDCYVDIPNSFTPNGDGANDYFLPRQYMSHSVSTFKMTIYNRWGQQVFQTVAIDGRGWDGKFNGEDQVQGVYVYQIEVGFDNGVKEQYTGNLTLLR